MSKRLSKKALREKNSFCSPEEIDEQFKAQENKIKLGRYKKTTLENATILYESIIWETFNIKEFEKVSEIIKDEFNVGSYAELVQHMQVDKALFYSKHTQIVFKDGDKITIARYVKSKEKRQGIKYFKTRRNNFSLSLNLKSGCFYIVDTQWNCNKINHKVIKKNVFEFNDVQSLLNKETKDFFINYLQTEFDLPRNVDTFSDNLINWFIKFHKIKTSDIYRRNFINYYPGLPFLRKANFNLTDAIMLKYKLKGDRIKQIINNNDAVNIFNLVFFDKLITIEKMNEEFISNFLICEKDLNEKNHRTTFLKKVGFNLYDRTYQQWFDLMDSMLTSDEEDRLIKLIIESHEYVEVHELFDFLKKKFEIEIDTNNRALLTCTNYSEFQRETYLFTKLKALKTENKVIDIMYINPDRILLNNKVYHINIDRSSTGYLKGHFLSA